jgi:serine/threonine protein kinase
MSWINSRQFTISNRNGRHYVFRRNNAGNTEINIPSTVTTKGQAIAWLKAHPNKVANPTRYKAKRGAVQPGGLKPFERMVNGKKMVAFVNKEGKEYFRPAPGPEPNYFVNINRAKGKKVVNNFTCESLKKSLKTMKAIGKGRQGIVFLASRYTNGRYPFAIKVVPRDLRAVKRKEDQPGDVEFKIQKAVMEAAPDGVVEVRQILKCEDFVKPMQINMTNVQNPANYDKSNQTVITMEYASGGSLKDWLSKQPRITEGMVHHIISSIVKTLGKIQKKYPDFRHNDLHLENVFVADRGFLIGDFGWSRLEKMGTNPAVNTANGTSIAGRWGLGPKTDARYDSHMFLAEMRAVVKRIGNGAKFPQALAFLDAAVPMGYRGSSDVHTTEGRLKYGDPCPGLPTLARILKSKYLTGRSPSPNRHPSPPKPKAKPKPRAKALSASPVKRRASNRRVRSASARAGRGRLLYSNSQLMNMSPKSFLKLTAANKARAIALRKGKGASVAPKKAAPNNTTARKSTRPNIGAVLQKRKRAPVPREVLRSNKFNRLVEKIRASQGGPANESYNNARYRARVKAINQVENRINRGLAPFSPSPRKLPSPLSPLGPPPKPKPKAPSPPKPKPKAKNSNFKLSPSSGRAKVKSNSSGRWVYANLHFSMEELKRMAANKGLNTKGLRSKANIARKIFGGV